jgi:hypothetical protein
MTRSETTQVRVQGLQPAQVIAGLVGLVYLVGGIAGLIRTGFADYTANGQQVVLVFTVNGLHNTVNVVIGLLGLLMAVSSGLARAYGWILFVGWGLVSVWGLMLTGVISGNAVASWGNPLNLNAADNWLHIISALLGLVIAIMPARKVVQVTARAPFPDTAATSGEIPQQSRRDVGWHRRGGTAH